MQSVLSFREAQRRRCYVMFRLSGSASYYIGTTHLIGCVCDVFGIIGTLGTDDGDGDGKDRLFSVHFDMFVPAMEVVIAKERACSRDEESGKSTDEKERISSSLKLGVAHGGSGGGPGEAREENEDMSVIEDVRGLPSLGERNEYSGGIRTVF
jgi:hypothetical protein